ncbi:MAG: SP_1767 family glycosyltransferase [Ruminococcus flavefaciens]|nr:SP_1767 family glycosyltransferase [Ruminococcus flavefaciens]
MPEYAQVMVANIAHQLGFKYMGIRLYDTSGESDLGLKSRYDGIIASIHRGDIVFFQHPTWHFLKFEEGLINRIKVYGGRVVIVLHDVASLMFEFKRQELQNAINLYNSAEVLIVPSFAMKKLLQENGIRKNMKFVVQEIWDHVIDVHFSRTPEFQKEIHFAGNPSKFLFPNQWNFDIPLKVYTSEQCTGENVQMMGWMESENLLTELAKGGFGLVWYGSDYWHQYMKYNNTFKLSTYLAAGIPVIVPRGISNQYLIEKNHLGLVVDSLDGAAERVKEMGESDYQDYVHHVREFSPLIRNGYFTKKFLIEAVQALMRQDMMEFAVSDKLFEEMANRLDSDKKTVNIMDMQETLEYMKNKRISVARFGDGEMDLITGHAIPYQDYDEGLARRLKKIITWQDDEKLLVCLPDVFERRERYNDACNSFWNKHLEKYKNIYDEIIISEKCYGSTFVSRPYIDLADKSMSAKHFRKMKEFFADKDILIVEGFYSRSGVGNDLFQEAKSVERIICPSRNAYSKYEEILDAVRKYGVGKLILLMLGPTAKVLAADLALEGYWAVDIGHIDSEYEWYRAGVTQKTKLHHKHTAEFNYDEQIELQDDGEYNKEIVMRLCDD